MLRPQIRLLLTSPSQTEGMIRGAIVRCFADDEAQRGGGNPADNVVNTVRDTELSKQAQPGVYPDRDFVPEVG